MNVIFPIFPTFFNLFYHRTPRSTKGLLFNTQTLLFVCLYPYLVAVARFAHNVINEDL